MEEMEKLTPVLCSICEKTADKFKVCALETDFFFLFFIVLVKAEKQKSPLYITEGNHPLWQ